MTSSISDVFLIFQTNASKKCADAAQSAASTAANELAEIKKGGNDTHDLAFAAQIQARNSHIQIEKMEKQIEFGVKAATAAKLSADAANTAIRPWMKIDDLEVRQGIGAIKSLMFHWPVTNKVAPPLLQIKLTTHNVGHSVAQDVEAMPRFFIGRFDSSKWNDMVMREENTFCAAMARRSPDPTPPR